MSQTRQQAADYPLGHVDAEVGQSTAGKLLNEVYVFRKALNYVIPAANQARIEAWENKSATGVKMLCSFGLGLGLGLLAGRTGKLGLLGRGLEMAALSSFVSEAALPLYNGVGDAWTAKRQSDLDRASETLGHGVGAFAFETLLQTPGAMAGGKLASKFKVGEKGLWQTWRDKKNGSLETTVEDPLSGLSVGTKPIEPAVVPETASPAAAALDASNMTLNHGPAVRPGLLTETPVVENVSSAPVTTRVLPETTSASTIDVPALEAGGAANGGIKSGGSKAGASHDLGIGGAEHEIGTGQQSPGTSAITSKELDNATSKAGCTDLSGRPVYTDESSAVALGKDSAVKSSGTSASDAVAHQHTVSPADAAPELAADAAAAHAPTGGFKFVEIKVTDKTAPSFDLAVGIEDPVILDGRPVLRPRNMKSGPSLSLNALYMPKKELPGLGSTMAIGGRDADSLTAMAIIANRAQKRRVDESIVKLLAGEAGTANPTVATQDAVNAIRFTAQQDGVKIGDRVRFIRAVLDNTVTPKDLASAASAYEAMGRPAPLEGFVPGKITGVRSLNGHVSLEYTQPNDMVAPNFDYALGVDDKAIIGSARVIDRQGSLNIVQRVMAMKPEELPAQGSRVVVSQVDVPRLTAAAIIENRLSGTPMRRPLIDLILRDGAWTERIPEGERANVVAAYQAMEGFANDPHIAPRRKIAAIARLLAEDVPAAELQPVINEFQIFRPSQQPFHYVRTTFHKPKPFDFGVEITDSRLIDRQPNLDHHGPSATVNTPSAAEQALTLPDGELPVTGARVAIEKPDADALTAVAVLANRKEGLPVNERLVEAVGRRDRGFDTDVEGNSFTDVETPFIALRSFARNKNILINQRIMAIRALLAGMMRESELRGLTDRFHQNQWAREVRTEKASTVTEAIPGQLAFVETPRQNWFEARDLGLKQAPVAVIAARDAAGATHFEVVAKADHPAAEQLGGALSDLAKLEPGWAGRPNIFVSPSDSKLSPQQVLEIIASYLTRKAGR